MKTARTMFWVLTVIFLTWFCVMSFSLIAYAEDYAIKYYGQRVVSIEHDGVIHIMGRGEADRTDPVPLQNPWPSEAEETSNPTNLEMAQKDEKAGVWYMAAHFYQQAGKIEKMKEMAWKDIEDDFSQNPPNYRHAAINAETYLKDKGLAIEYYSKYLDQELQKE